MSKKEQETTEYWELVQQVATSNLDKFDEKQEQRRSKKQSKSTGILDETPDTTESLEQKIKTEVRKR